MCGKKESQTTEVTWLWVSLSMGTLITSLLLIFPSQTKDNYITEWVDELFKKNENFLCDMV
jgi:hypothetical protein